MTRKDPRQVQRMFSRIVRRYDLLNRLMSLGMDVRWRREAARAVRPSGRSALDIGTGTGDLAAELLRQGASHVTGVDFSPEMVRTAQTRVASKNSGRMTWATADALRLPFADKTFDCLTNAFVLRNLADLPTAFAEMARVLKPRGHIACLDMTRPPRGVFGSAFRVYFSRVVPPLAGLISGDPAAYRYLPNSVLEFHTARHIASLMERAGFVDVRFRLFGRGAVALHSARKP